MRFDITVQAKLDLYNILQRLHIDNYKICVIINMDKQA
jgi:hypothetical protein